MKLIICQGLPGAGKSTWAAAQIGAIIVNKDQIRRRLEQEGWIWSPESEKQVLEIRDRHIIDGLGAGKDVISDDTNLAKKHLRRLFEIGQNCGAEVSIKRFDTPIEECIRRDSLREGKARVGEQAIRSIADRYKIGGEQRHSFAPMEKGDLGLPNVIICDIDGTLALFKGRRSPYDVSTCEGDLVNHPVAGIIRLYAREGIAQILYVSGREDKYQEKTQRWLDANGLPKGPLFMRKTGDMRKDWIIKGEILDAEIRGKYNVEFCLDDRNQVVNFWRSIGLTCLQVAEGDF